jgi:hypothetical protein
LGLSLLSLCPSGSIFADPVPDPSPSAKRPFAPGERLGYTLAWFKLGAGNAVLEVAETPPVRGRPALKFQARATSGSIVTKLYPVDNRVESIVDAATLRPHRFIFHRSEGKKKNDFDVTFQHAAGTVSSTKDGQTETLPIPPDTQDPISILYYVRSLPTLTPGTTVVLNVHHDKKNYRVQINVEGVESVKGPWGKVDAIRILVIMPFQGIFLNEGNIKVWLTNDPRRIPVMMKAKVIIGSVVARLTEGFP